MSVLLVLLNCLILSNAFNLDIPSFIMHSSSREGSMFGFSVAMYSHQNSSSLLIGAPAYQTNQPGVRNAGAVLHCDSGYGGTCKYVPFDIAGDAAVLGVQSDSKSNQWFGATVRASKNNDVVVACAPRYVWYTLSLKKRDPVGVCYVARNGLTEFEEFSPCRNENWGYHRQGFCQAGFDAALTSNGDRLYIGAPGAYYWQGQVHSQEFGGRYRYFATGESYEEDDNQYLGYSVASGDFNGDGVEDVALGVPKGLNYTGKISIYSEDLRWLRNITGDQLGSYFGYSLAVVDFNGDGRDDIVVGSPMYTDYSDREMKIEVGRVHVLMQSESSSFSADVIYTGEVHKARLGLSVASLGDINLDGFGDIAVGAPYGGVDGRGAVFIYHGFSAEPYYDEKLLKPAQILYAEDVGNGVSTFGWSLSGGVDTDRNQYPDLLVGAYESDQAFLFKSRPIVKFHDLKIEFLSEGKTVDIKTKNCDLPQGAGSTCLNLEFCLSYKGINVDDNIELDVSYNLDTRTKSDRRLLFQKNRESTYTERVRYQKEEKECRTMQTFVVPNLTDKLTPITAEVSYELIQRRRSTRSLTPVLNAGQQLSISDSVTIQNDCGPDNVCIPDLILTAEIPDEFIIGKKEMMSISVKVVNKGQDAFEASVYMTIPPGLLFNKFVRTENSSLALSTTKANGTNFVKVYLGNPLTANEEATFSVMFQQAEDVVEPFYEFVITANSTNAEAAGYFENNVIRKTVQSKIDAEVVLFGSSDPELLIYNTTEYRFPFRSHEKHIGPSVIHKYGLLNKGPSETEEVDIMILWPTRTQNGNHLLYLMEQPFTVGNVECKGVPDVNPLQYTLISDEEKMKLLGVSSLDSFSQATFTDYKARTGYSSSSSQSGQSASGSYSGSGGYSSGTRTSSSSSFESTGSSSSGSRTTYTSSSGGSSYGGSSSAGGGRYGGSSSRTEYGSSSYEGTQGGTDVSSTYGSGRYGGGGRYVSTSSSTDSGYPGSTEQGYSSSVRKEYSSSSSGSGTAGSSRGGSGYSSTSQSQYGGGARDNYGGQTSQGASSQTNYQSSSGGYSSGSRQTGYGEGGYSSSSGNYGSSSQAGSDGYGSSSQTGYDASRQGQYESSRTSYSSTGGQYGGGQSSYGSSGQRGYSAGTQYSSSSQDSGRGSLQGSGFFQGPGNSGVARTYTLTGSEGSNTLSGNTNRAYESSSSRDQSTSGNRDYGQSGSSSAGDRRYQNSFSTEYSSSSGNYGSEGTGGNFNTGDQSYQTSSTREYSSSGTYGSSSQGAARPGSFDWGANQQGYESGSQSRTSGGYTETSETKYSTSDDGTTTRTSTYSRKYNSPPFNQLNQPYDETPGRTKRDAVEDQWYALTSDCGASSCTRIQCKVKKLQENEDVYIYLRSRLYMNTVSQFKFPTERLFVSTRLVTRTRVSARGVGDDIVEVDTKDVRTELKSAKSLGEAPAVPWWVWLLAILCGILILVILILILYKCGYFQRHRPEHTATLHEDAQPLNSNGRNGSASHQYYPGDEAL